MKIEAKTALEWTNNRYKINLKIENGTDSYLAASQTDTFKCSLLLMQDFIHQKVSISGIKLSRCSKALAVVHKGYEECSISEEQQKSFQTVQNTITQIRTRSQHRTVVLTHAKTAFLFTGCLKM